MLYRNVKTGAEFESPCTCSGESWERVEVTKPASQPIQKPEKPAKTPKKGAGKK